MNCELCSRELYLTVRELSVGRELRLEAGELSCVARRCGNITITATKLPIHDGYAVNSRRKPIHEKQSFSIHVYPVIKIHDKKSLPNKNIYSIM